MKRSSVLLARKRSQIEVSSDDRVSGQGLEALHFCVVSLSKTLLLVLYPGRGHSASKLLQSTF